MQHADLQCQRSLRLRNLCRNTSAAYLRRQAELAVVSDVENRATVILMMRSGAQSYIGSEMSARRPTARPGLLTGLAPERHLQPGVKVRLFSRTLVPNARPLGWGSETRPARN